MQLPTHNATLRHPLRADAFVFRGTVPAPFPCTERASVTASASVAPSLLRCGLAAALAALAGCSTSPARLAPSSAAGIADDDAQCPPASLRTSQRFSATPYASGLPTQGQWRDGFDLADMDGDGRLDLLHGPARKGDMRPTIFRGDGRGGFSAWRETHFPPLPYDYGDAKAADLNGDGRLDIALAAHLRGLVTLINEGGGHYAPWGEGLVLRSPDDREGAAPFASRNLALVDWNGDGAIDLLALNEGPSRFAGLASQDAVALHLNRGGHWERVRGPQPLQGFGDALAVGDVDGDGRPDALLGTQLVGARFALQIGDGATMHSRELRSLPPHAAITAVALHDFDGDGRDEIVDATRAMDDRGRCSALQTVALRASGDEAAATLWREASLDPVIALAHGDIDGDGRDDLVAVRRGGEILLFARYRDGFRRDHTIAPPTAMAGCDAFDATLADLDAAPGLELVVSYAGDHPAGGGCTHGGGFLAWRLQGR